MIDKEKIKLCAENIANSINMKEEGEYILIKGGFYAHQLLEEIGLNILRKGGIPHITSTSDYYDEAIFNDDLTKPCIIEKTPMHYLKLIEKMDAYIVIEPLEDPSIRNNAPKEKLDAYTKSIAPYRDIIYGFKEEYSPGKKWCYAAWPSKKAAEYYNINYNLFEKFIIEGISIPPEKIKKIVKTVGEQFINAKKVYVCDDNGTDFWVSVEDRVKTLDDGVLSDEQIALGNLGGNLPAGEVFYPPIETQGEGKIFVPLTKERYTHTILKNVEIFFKDGKLILDKITADSNIETLIKAFEQCENIDRANNVTELRTYNIGELGIGCNPVITKAIGYILTDEKIYGSAHVAFGFNKHFGGTSTSQMHWDFVTAPTANITVEYKDDSKRKIMENGKLLK